MSPIAFLALLLLFAAQCSAQTQLDYSNPKWYEGDGTYYGAGTGTSKWNDGNCAYREPPSYFLDYVPVAMNNVQYKLSCGACLEVTGSGNGAGANPIVGTFRAMVMDKCPHPCKEGDLDLAKDGDGRWDLKWRVIPCDLKSARLTFQFEGSNKWYHKLQPRGLKTPAKEVFIDGVSAEFSDDNHWIAQKGSGFSTPTKIEIETFLGERIVAEIDSYVENGIVEPSSLSGDEPSSGKDDEDAVWKEAEKKEAERTEAERKQAERKEAERKKAERKEAEKKKEEEELGNNKCVPMWNYCRGQRNRWGTSRCCDGGQCVLLGKYGWGCVTSDFLRKWWS